MATPRCPRPPRPHVEGWRRGRGDGHTRSPPRRTPPHALFAHGAGLRGTQRLLPHRGRSATGPDRRHCGSVAPRQVQSQVLRPPERATRSVRPPPRRGLRLRVQYDQRAATRDGRSAVPALSLRLGGQLRPPRGDIPPDDRGGRALRAGLYGSRGRGPRRLPVRRRPGQLPVDGGGVRGHLRRSPGRKPLQCRQSEALELAGGDTNRSAVACAAGSASSGT